jgi:translation elongation factor P/translation initiation factor 5A
MAVLIDAINVKKRTLFELDNTPFSCLEAEVNTPTARGGQTLVRLKIRNLLTNAVFERTFKASDKFKEPDLQMVPASYLYSDGEGSHFLDQETFETLTLAEEVIGNALEFLRRTGSCLHRTGCAGRFVKRKRDQAGHPRNRPGDPRSPLYQGRRKGTGVDREPGVCRAGINRSRL